MAILLRGVTRCGLCGEPIGENDAEVMFPAFAVDDCDPFLKFSDAVFHEACIRKDPQGIDVIDRVNMWIDRTAPDRRVCLVCGKKIIDPNDYLFVDFLTGDKLNPLYNYNYTHIHVSCVLNWSDRSYFLKLILDAQRSRRRPSKYLETIFKAMQPQN